MPQRPEEGEDEPERRENMGENLFSGLIGHSRDFGFDFPGDEMPRRILNRIAGAVNTL